MMAVILAGGKGTRLRPFTVTLPKPLMPLGETPILEIVLRQLAAVGTKRVALCVGTLAHLIEAVIGDGSRFGVRIEYVREEEPLGTAGALRLVKGLEDPFLVMNGDLLTTIDYAAMIRTHREGGAWGTIALSRREVAIDYGVIVTARDGQVEQYLEKPKISYDVSMGINVLNARCVEFLPPKGRFDMPDLMTAMRQAGKKVSGYRTDCYWQDIGRMDDYQRASEDFEQDPSRFLPPAASLG